MKKNLWVFLLGAAVIVVLDQITKSAITVGAVLMIWEMILNRKSRQAAS